MIEFLGRATPSDLELLLISILVLWVPGLVVAGATGVRGWVLLGAAPAVTYGLAAVASTVGTAVGFAWSVAYFALAIALAIAASVLVAAWRRRRAAAAAAAKAMPESWSRTGSALVAATAAAAGAVASAVFLRGTGGVGAVGQGWDAPFHANALRYIAETGNSSSTGLTALGNPETAGTFFYPNLWHSFHAIIFELTAQDVPRVMNAGALVLAALAFPLGVVALVRANGGRASFAAACALVSSSFAAMPFDLWTWGQLYPYAAALAMVPPFLALLIMWLRVKGPALTALTALIAFAIFLAHPGAVFVAAVPAALLIGQHLVARRHDIGREFAWIAALAASAAALVTPHLAGVLSAAPGVAGFDWAVVSDISTAFGDALLLGHAAPAPQWTLGLLMLAGAVVLAGSPGWRWAVISGAVFAFLFVTAAALDGTWMETLTAPWYNDRYRLAAAVPLFGILAAGAALHALAVKAADIATPFLWSGRPVRAATALSLLLVAGLYAVATQFFVERNSDRLRPSFASPVVSEAEQNGMQALAGLVPPGSRVMNDRGDGSVWTYALTGVPTVFPHYGLPGGNENRALLMRSFNDAATNSAVRSLIDEFDISHVILGDGFIAWDRVEGLTNLDERDWLHLVYRNREFRIYEVDRAALGITDDGESS